ncbi:Serine/arginine repetitive matrix protein [Actinidia chinensis var. chinensis]|uniref:Serine/arginine repetitive matrix protein n=1 Tax=Actinidia chinensis var. chinensis TaxID=1590841 RepID=A0A2R6QJ43_ACTCC|nr:Serine/arginine repetitive matrix protein [Actinidia chinensis var. chinensis]
MSGGFFRGTSADQDTRFSNKQAKLLKSQKFAPELDHLVDMTKVKMDVMRPWIANRVTEFLGFEDEVLINFIYGLLDGKVVNGKEVQISLTGFMEKNTGKFMKELWVLLLSAQNNASGVPQQFLDAKEEETRKKKAETDRIASEIQMKKEKEGRELEQEKMRKMDGEGDVSRANNAARESNSKHDLRASSAHSEDEKEVGERNGSRGRNRVFRSLDSVGRSSLSPQNKRSRSISKSLSNSRSYSDERRKSKSISQSPQHTVRSVSSEKVYHSPPRRSVTPRRRYSPQRSLSPPRHRSSHSKRRSTSRPRHRSPSPIRRRLRSPLRRRSRSLIRPRSRSPVRPRSRSPVRYRSRSPIRRRSPSPVRRRSPSPVRRRSPAPLRHRSPSPMRRRSPSPMRRRYRRSPSTPRHRSPSPIRRRSPIPSRRRLPTPPRRRSPSPEESSSPSPVRRFSPSPNRRKSSKRQRSPMQSPRERIRTFEKFSPVRHAHTRENAENFTAIRKGPDSVVRRPPISLRSPQRDPRHHDNTRKKATSSSPSPYKSQSHSESPPGSRRRSPSKEDKRSYGAHVSPVRQTNAHKLRDISASPPRKPKDHKPRRESPKASEEKEETNYARGNGGQKLKSSEKRSANSLTADKHQDSVERVHYKDDYSPERLGGHRSDAIRSRPDGLELRKKDLEIRSEKTSGRALHPESSDQQLPTINKVSPLSERHRIAYPEDASKGDEKNHSRFNEVKGSKQLHETETAVKMSRKVDRKDRIGSLSSGSQESDKHHHEVHEKRKHKRRERQEVSSDDSSDSEIEDRKEAKRRRKEEKRLRKEERRRRREERRRRREERRSEKIKAKSIDTVTPPSDYEKKNHDGNASDGERIVRKDSGASNAEVTESEQKKLEIELRKKALESLRAKKGVGH